MSYLVDHSAEWRLRHFLLLLLPACADPTPAAPLELPTCPDASPAELGRLPDPDRTVDRVDVFDLSLGVSIRTTIERKTDNVLLDNCGGEPLPLSQKGQVLTGATNLGDQLGLCPSLSRGEGIYTLLEDGTAGEVLIPDGECPQDYRLSAFGVVRVGEGGDDLQFREDGSTRVLPSTLMEPIWTGSDPVLFRLVDDPEIYPVGATDPIATDLPQIDEVVQLPGRYADAGWVIGVPPIGTPRGVLVPGDEVQSPIYAVEPATGTWFTASAEWIYGELADAVSVRDGLLLVQNQPPAAEAGSPVVYRASWQGSALLPIGGYSFTVLDAQRAFVITPDALQVVQIPMEQPSGDLEVEVLSSRPWTDAGEPASVAGVAWNDLVLVERTDGVWAFPIEDGEPYRFSPLPVHAHYGAAAVTGLTVSPDDGEQLQLYRARPGSEVELIETEIISTALSGDVNDPMLTHTWAPDTGRVVYAVRDGDAISVRQHRFED